MKKASTFEHTEMMKASTIMATIDHSGSLPSDTSTSRGTMTWIAPATTAPMTRAGMRMLVSRTKRSSVCCRALVPWP